MATGRSSSKTNFVDIYAILKTKNPRLKFTTGANEPDVSQFVQAELAKSSNLNPKSLYENRVKNKFLHLENPARESREKKQREIKLKKQAAQKQRRRLGIIGRKDAAVKGVWEMDKEHAKYELFVPLHNLWLGYMSELLNLAPPPAPIGTANTHVVPNTMALHSKLVKADFHGSIINVMQSKNPCLVGLRGIVIHETENTFKVITPNNQLKLIPKSNSIFSLRIPLYDVRSADELIKQMIPSLEFQLYGNHFRFRAADRSSRKFKHKETIEL